MRDFNRKYDRLKIISAKDLGRLALPDFCPRCFWLERHLDKPPSLFPGIFSTLDALTRRNVEGAFSEKEAMPDWLPISDVAYVEEGDTFFKMPVKECGWVLVGKPDNVFKLRDQSYHIVDYKTAKFTGRQDELFPMYKIQLNSYAYLAENYGLNPVSKLSLIYCEPSEDLDGYDDFKLSFSIHSLDIEKNLEETIQLLLKARETVDEKKPPEPRPGCKGICGWLDRAFKNPELF